MHRMEPFAAVHVLLTITATWKQRPNSTHERVQTFALHISAQNRIEETLPLDGFFYQLNRMTRAFKPFKALSVRLFGN